MAENTQNNEDKNKKLRHSANNHLAVIIGYAQLLNLKIDKENKESEWIKKILHECEKLKNTISKIK